LAGRDRLGQVVEGTVAAVGAFASNGWGAQAMLAVIALLAITVIAIEQRLDSRKSSG
jgi:hypothetical protein